VGNKLSRQLVAVRAHITIGQEVNVYRLLARSPNKPKRGTNKKF
jgi:hypothetical protein